MRFKKHSDYEGHHSLLSPSKYHWINYSPEKFAVFVRTRLAAARGSELHDFASQAIRLGQKLSNKQDTLNKYVNDCIRFAMTPEVLLFYSPNAFGSADAISFRNMELMIFDLKTGVSKASFNQLMCYVALFCLEYHIKPEEIRIELRIYQENEITIYEPPVTEIRRIMVKYVDYDKMINKLAEEEV